MLAGVASVGGTNEADTILDPRFEAGLAPEPIESKLVSPAEFPPSALLATENKLIALVLDRMLLAFLPLPVSFFTNRLVPHSPSKATSSKPASGSCSSIAASSTRSIRRSASRITKTKISLIRSQRWSW